MCMQSVWMQSYACAHFDSIWPNSTHSKEWIVYVQTACVPLLIICMQLNIANMCSHAAYKHFAYKAMCTHCKQHTCICMLVVILANLKLKCIWWNICKSHVYISYVQCRLLSFWCYLQWYPGTTTGTVNDDIHGLRWDQGPLKNSRIFLKYNIYYISMQSYMCTF